MEGNRPVLSHTLLATVTQRGNKICAVFKLEMCSALLSSFGCSRSRKTRISHAWVELRGEKEAHGRTGFSGSVQMLFVMCSGLSGTATPAGA